MNSSMSEFSSSNNNTTESDIGDDNLFYDFDHNYNKDDYYDDGDSWKQGVSYGIAALTLTTCSLSLFFIASILPTTKKSTFNLYIVFIMIPDAVLNGMEGIRCIYEGRLLYDIPKSVCDYRNFSILFYYYSNLWVNSVVAREIQKLVVNSYHRIRTQPPTYRRVLWQVFLVYLCSALISGWFIAPGPWSPLTSDHSPAHCKATFGSKGGWNKWAGFGVALVISLPPFFYVFWVSWDIYHRKLLPLRGRTRVLAVYFFRIIFIFFAFYLPMTILAFAKNSIPHERHESTAYFWILSVFTMITPCQNLVTMACLLQKDDISRAVTKNLSRMFPTHRCSSRRYSNHRTSAHGDDRNSRRSSNKNKGITGKESNNHLTTDTIEDTNTHANDDNNTNHQYISEWTQIDIYASERDSTLDPPMEKPSSAEKASVMQNEASGNLSGSNQLTVNVVQDEEINV